MDSVPLLAYRSQTSTLASVVLFTFVARYLSKSRRNTNYFKSIIMELWLPVSFTLILILPANSPQQR
jgi:cell division protein FtsW